jgi:hypothetical protein
MFPSFGPGGLSIATSTRDTSKGKKVPGSRLPNYNRFRIFYMGLVGKPPEVVQSGIA